MPDRVLVAYGKEKEDIVENGEVVGFRIWTAENEADRKNTAFRCSRQLQVSYRQEDHNNSLVWERTFHCDDETGGKLTKLSEPNGDYVGKPTQSKPAQRKRRAAQTSDRPAEANPTKTTG